MACKSGVPFLSTQSFHCSLELRMNSTSADAEQRAEKVNLSVTHSSCCSCCVLWVEMKKTGSHGWMSTFLREAGGCCCPSYCLPVLGLAAHCAQWKFTFYFEELAGVLSAGTSCHPVGPPLKLISSVLTLSSSSICGLSLNHSSVSILLFYVTAALTHIVKAILVCVCLSILYCVFFLVGLQCVYGNSIVKVSCVQVPWGALRCVSRGTEWPWCVSSA